jgi:hypothetical protein
MMLAYKHWFKIKYLGIRRFYYAPFFPPRIRWFAFFVICVHWRPAPLLKKRRSSGSKVQIRSIRLAPSATNAFG